MEYPDFTRRRRYHRLSSSDRAALFRFFETRFGGLPTHLVRAPGRVNLIGEHIDYAGLSVLPIALQHRVSMALRPRPDSVVCIANLEEVFGERTFEIAPELTPGPAGDWENYLRAPAHHLTREHGPLLGFDAVVGSDLPRAAGLASSAAVVVACGAGLASVNGLAMEPARLAEAMAQAERFVGTEGGGMDQAICLSAREGHAARIDFGPLRLTHVPVPEGWTFIVANSLTPAEKSAGARDAYNRRSRESVRALSLVRHALGDEPHIGYSDLLAQHDVIELFTMAEWALEGSLLPRFRHIVTEGIRVRRAERAMAEGDRALFGVLMQASHASLRDDYEVSADALDRLCDVALDAGADGARLTGAGFGGCAVVLCASERTEELLGALDRGFYRTKPTPAGSERAFVAHPSGGATIEAL